MSCAKWEERIALYVEGDEAGFQAVEAHLRECPACRELAEALRESQAALKSLSDEPAESLALERVRRTVLAEIAAPPRRAMAWAWQLALAGMLLAVAGGWIWWRSQRVELTPPVTARVAVPEKQSRQLAAQPERVTQRLAPRRRKRAAQPPPRRLETEPLMVKLATDDPNVVIIWMVDRNGGEE